MSTPNNVNPFDGLPPEMICYIFDYLDLDTLKSVSLTCRRLERIFSSYCCGRFMLYVKSRFVVLPLRHGVRERACAINESRDIEPTTKFIAKKLKHSKRYYQKVHMVLHQKLILPMLPKKLSESTSDKRQNSGQSRITPLNMILKTDWLPQLVVLKLVMGYKSYQYFTQLSAAVAKMNRLQELQFIENMYVSFEEYSEELKIENNTLQRLVLETVLPSVINCPKLRKLEVAYALDAETNFGKQYAQYGGEEPYWKLKQLEEFTIIHRKIIDINDYTLHTGNKLRFYQQLTKLKKYHCYGEVSDKSLQSICESFRHLEDLFLGIWKAKGPNSIRCLSNLTHLRRFGIWRSWETLSFASVHAPKLEYLSLGSVDVIWESLEQLEAIKSLSIRDSNFTEAKLLVKHMKQLECLWLDFHQMWSNYEHAKKILLHLEELPLLKTLILENLRFCDYYPIIPPLPQLKRLVLFKCYTSKNLEMDTRRFPNVKRIELEVPESFASDYEKYLYEDEA